MKKQEKNQIKLGHIQASLDTIVVGVDMLKIDLKHHLDNPKAKSFFKKAEELNKKSCALWQEMEKIWQT